MSTAALHLGEDSAGEVSIQYRPTHESYLGLTNSSRGHVMTEHTQLLYVIVYCAVQKFCGSAFL